MIEPSLLRAGLLGILFAGAAGCAGETVTPAEPVQDPTPLYWRLTLNQHAINLSTAAPYDTFRLVATPRRLDGAPRQGPTQVQFTSDDPNAVLVGADGLVQAIEEATHVQITVRVTQGEVTHQLPVLVNVTATPNPPVLARLSLESWLLAPFTGEPSPSDSAKAAAGSSSDVDQYYPSPYVLPRAFDTAGNELSGLAVWLESSDSAIARYDNFARSLSLPRPGDVTFTASTVAYGVERTATLAYRVGLPLRDRVVIRTRFGLNGAPIYDFRPSTAITIAAGGYLQWFHGPTVPLFDVTFEDPAAAAEDALFCAFFGHCGGGNIEPFGDSTGNPFTNTRSRYFPVPGMYRYHSTVLNASGTIVVMVDESQPQATSPATATHALVTRWRALRPTPVPLQLP